MIKKRKNNLKHVLKKYYTKCYGAFDYNDDLQQWTYGGGERSYIFKHYRNITIDFLGVGIPSHYNKYLLFIFNNDLLKISNRNKKYYFEFEMLLHKEVLSNINIKNQYLNRKYSYIYISFIHCNDSDVTFSGLSECILSNKTNVFFLFETDAKFSIKKYSNYIGSTYIEYLICVRKKGLFKYLCLLKKNLKKGMNRVHVKMKIVKNTFDFFNHKFLYNLYKKDINYPLVKLLVPSQSFRYFNYGRGLKDFYIIGDHLSCMSSFNFSMLGMDITEIIELSIKDKVKYNVEKSKKFAKLGIGSLGLLYSLENYIYIP